MTQGLEALPNTIFYDDTRSSRRRVVLQRGRLRKLCLDKYSSHNRIRQGSADASLDLALANSWIQDGPHLNPHVTDVNPKKGGDSFLRKPSPNRGSSSFGYGSKRSDKYRKLSPVPAPVSSAPDKRRRSPPRIDDTRRWESRERPRISRSSTWGVTTRKHAQPGGHEGSRKINRHFRRRVIATPYAGSQSLSPCARERPFQRSSSRNSRILARRRIHGYGR